MSAPQPNPGTLAASAYDVLKRQMPIFAFRDEVNPDPYIEPLPTQVGQWSKFSRILTCVNLALVLGAAAFLAMQMNKSIAIKRQLIQVPLIQTRLQLTRYCQADRLLKEKNVARKAREAAVTTALEEVLKQAKAWEIQKGNKFLTVVLYLDASRDLQELAPKAAERLAPLKWEVSGRPEISHNREVMRLKYGNKQ